MTLNFGNFPHPPDMGTGVENSQILKFSPWHMWRNLKYPSLSTNYVNNLWCFVAFYTVLLHNMFFGFMQFCCKIVLSRFTRYCVEKIWAKNCACGETRTNIRYTQSDAMSREIGPRHEQPGPCKWLWIKDLWADWKIVQTL